MEQKNEAAQGFGSHIPVSQQSSGQSNNSQGFQPNFSPFYPTTYDPNPFNPFPVVQPLPSTTVTNPFNSGIPMVLSSTTHTNPFNPFPVLQPQPSTTVTNPFNPLPMVQPLSNTTHTNPFNSGLPMSQSPPRLIYPDPINSINNQYSSSFNFNYPTRYPYSSSVDNFNDDEPLPAPPAAPATLPNSGLKNVAVETSTEFPAVAASVFNSSFAVLLGIHAPPLPMEVGSENQRVPIDLVAVLDVSGSMVGEKLSLLKYATKFVIDHMLPCDRLSIISFSSHATRILPLRRMTERGRKDAEFSVDQLRAEGGTNIVAGLNMGAQVLEQRRQCNPVSSIIFLSDGQDNYNSTYGVFSKNTSPGYLRWLSSSISSCNSETNDENQRQRFPVYTFGVGMDHDAIAMNAIADGSCGGTFSFVESAEMIPRSFARCIGGLFSVVAQDVRIKVLSASPGVEIKSIPSGRHTNEIDSQHKQGIIHVGDLFAEEKKEFLIYLSVPNCSSVDHMLTEDNEAIIKSKTPLLDIVCYYRNAFTDELVQIDGPSIEILRPITLSPADKVVNLKVDGQKNRVAVAESIAKAKEMADRGNLRGAKEVLTSTRENLLASASAHSGVEMVSWLEAELKEISARMENMDLYQQQGRPFMLAGMSAHDAQRATTRKFSCLQAQASASGASFGAMSFASAGAACGAAYDTPFMTQMQSEVQMPPPPPPGPKKDNGWRN